MMRRMSLLALAGLSFTATTIAQPVLMISIDGLHPEYITQADQHKLSIPTLRGFLTEGSYAERVIGMAPTSTFPNHTTLITGVSPAQHGIENNVFFDPQRQLRDSTYWYARDIRVQTLWQAAADAGLSTASVGWPVTVAAPGIDVCIPEYGFGDPTDLKMAEALAVPDGLLRRLQARLGPYRDFAYEDGDIVRARFAIEILKESKPGFMTVHFSALDGRSHLQGPFSPAAFAALEATDKLIAQLMDAAMARLRRHRDLCLQRNSRRICL